MLDEISVRKCHAGVLLDQSRTQNSGIVFVLAIFLLCMYIYAMVSMRPSDYCGIPPRGMDVKQMNASTPSLSCIDAFQPFFERDWNLLYL